MRVARARKSVEVRGNALTGGSDYRCKFADVGGIPASFVNDGAIACRSPPLPAEELDKAGLTPDDIMPVCVEVTLNGNRSQATKNCVEFTYYDF